MNLAMCRLLANLMHGSIGVESTPGRGSLFWFTAGVEKSFVAEREPAKPKRVISDRPLLIVIDNPELCGQMLTESASVGLACHIEDREVLLSEAVTHTDYAMVFVDSEESGIVTTITAWHAEATRQVPVVGVPRRERGDLDVEAYHGLLQDWLGEEETQLTVSESSETL